MRASIIAIILAVAAGSAFAQRPENAKKADAASGSYMEMTVVSGGQRTDIKSTQYQTHDGYILKNPDGKFMLFFGAGSKGDGPSFTFTGQLDKGEVGTYKIGGENTTNGFNLMATVLQGNTLLMPQEDGEIIISAFPLPGGFVTGTFHGICQTVTDDGEVKKLDVSGSFRLIRR